MQTHLSYTLAQQHIDELRAAADHRRLAAQGAESRPARARRLVQMCRMHRPWGAAAPITLSSDA